MHVLTLISLKPRWFDSVIYNLLPLVAFKNSGA